MNFAGYTIPAGWVVMVVPSVLHLNADKYNDPLTFNPWRWEVIIQIIKLINYFWSV